MIIALVILIVYVFFIWLFFFQLKIAKFNIPWAIATFWVGIHVVLVFVIGLRFCQPYSIDATVVRYTIQIVPRLPEPTLLTEVLVEPNVPVKKGTPLFQFDKRIYQYNVDQLQASLAAAKQNVLVLEASVEQAAAAVEAAQAQVKFAEQQVARYKDLSETGAARKEEYQKWVEQLVAAQAQVAEAQANEKKARLTYDSQIDGVNTTVAQTDAELKQAEYYLEHTTIYAPEDGFITNLQVRPGLVVGILRVGAMCSFVCDKDPYILATFQQPHLKFVKEGMPVEVALDLYPGRILNGKVQSIWWATGQGQYMPEGHLPRFVLPTHPKGKFAVEIKIDEGQDVRLPAGIQGTAAIYTGYNKILEPLRKIEIRIYSWGRYLYPMPF